MADIIISGYHGFANSGDEALLFAILTTLRRLDPDIDITVLSKTPRETSRLYSVKSIYRYNFFKIRKEMKKSKMLLFGGGSLLQDATSSKSILYYLGIIALAQKLGLKTMLYANGIGPITKKFNRNLSNKILNRADLITLRDDKSDEELKSLHVSKPEIIITADPAFTIDVDTSLSGKYLRRMAGVDDGKKLFVVSVREWKTSCKNFEEHLARLCDYMVENYGFYPLFIPMQYPDDIEISKKVMKQMHHPAYIISRSLSVPETFSVLSEAELVVGMRLHSLIYATTLEIPAMALVYDMKISAFMDSVNQPDWLNVEEFSFENAKDTVDTIIKEKEIKKEEIRKTNALLKQKAQENALYAINLFNR